MVRGWRRLTHREMVGLRIRRARSSWWFEALIQHAPENDGALNAEIYESIDQQRDRAFVLVDRSSNRIFVYVSTA